MNEFLNDFLKSWIPKEKEMIMMIPTLELLYKNMEELINEIESQIFLNKS